MTTATRLKLLSIGAAFAVGLAAAPISAQNLRIGLQEDPDLLDPDTGRTFVGRIVFAAMCDKLIDIDPELSFVPQLATSWSWSDDALALTMSLRQGVRFQDGEPFNAEAVKFNIERSQTLPGSRRKSELATVSGVDVVDEHTVRINVSAPFSPLLAALADRAGMMVSPKAAAALGEDLATAPVCAGPFAFTERVQQERIVLEKFDGYWNADAIGIERVEYRIIPDTTVRLANLQSGDLDMIERLATSDIAAVEADPRLSLEQATGLGYQGLTVNLNNGPRADNPLGNDPRVREALELAIDRNVINQVVFDGRFLPGNQPVPPTNPFYIGTWPTPERDVERAKALLAEAGVSKPTFELMVTNNPIGLQVGQVVQAMASEAGFNLELKATEFATALQRQSAGDFELFLIGWSGRVDPDGNIHIFVETDGALNDGKYSNPEADAAVNAARQSSVYQERHALYEKAAQHYLADRPRIYLYHVKWFWAVSDDVDGFVPFPDGMIRLQGVKLGS
ncbi:MAG: ABC transporter substrate-binding protein [Inquilinus sp.]|nr:ABC transporter substrate-binding protein [Inquilinus sp.]